MDDELIVAGLIRDRTCWEALAGRLDADDFSEWGKAFVKAAGTYYRRDPSATSADPNVLLSEISRGLSNNKHIDAARAYVDGLPAEVSGLNVAAEYRLLRRHSIGLELAALLAAGEHDKAERFLEKYRLLNSEQSELRGGGIDDIAHDDDGTAERFKVHPGRFNAELKGRLKRGHSILIVGRPESGKSMFAINLAGGFIKQGLRVLYVGNEEPILSIQYRLAARLSGIGISEIDRESGVSRLAEARERIKERGYDNWAAYQLESGRIAELEALVRAQQPDVVIVDQLRNLRPAGSDSLVTSLEASGRAVRQIGSKYNCIVVSVTQAGDSAEQKLTVGMSDIDNSKTGLPGAADLIVGVGVTKAWDAAGKRMITLSKNKVSGSHQQFKLWLDIERQMFLSRPPKRSR